jgi:hypothetical protein
MQVQSDRFAGAFVHRFLVRHWDYWLVDRCWNYL